MATMLLRIDGLEPGSESTIVSALEPLPGVFGVVVNPAEDCVEVDLEDDEIDFDRILDRLRAAGFEARLSG
jgi:copper chaperone CopZ